jgi:copper chaperone CopZ
MEELTLAVPGMWADHHVLAVRDLLREDDAVAFTDASALERTVRIEFDGSRTDRQRITTLLAQGGYACGEPEDAARPPLDKPAWATAGVRVTTTNAFDLTMSGDHRKY